MRKTLLVVDDSVTIREATKLALTGEGWSVVEASTAEEALSLLATQAPDAVLCDVVLGEEDGYDLCRRIHLSPEGAGVPVVLMGSKVSRTAADAVGAAGNLVKPFSSDELLEALQSALENAAFALELSDLPPAEAEPVPEPGFPDFTAGGPDDDLEIIELSSDEEFEELELLEDLEPVEPAGSAARRPAAPPPFPLGELRESSAARVVPDDFFAGEGGPDDFSTGASGRDDFSFDPRGRDEFSAGTGGAVVSSARSEATDDFFGRSGAPGDLSAEAEGPDDFFGPERSALLDEALGDELSLDLDAFHDQPAPVRAEAAALPVAPEPEPDFPTEDLELSPLPEPEPPSPASEERAESADAHRLEAEIARTAEEAARAALEKSLSAELLVPAVEAIVQRVVWEVVPPLAERLIREAIEKLRQEPPEG